MIGRVVAIAAFVCLSSPLSANNDSGNDKANLRVVVDFNFVTGMTNHWESSGAFVDQGVLGNGTEVFKGYTAKVTDDPHGQYGTFTWTFTKAVMPGSEFGEKLTQGSWRMISGTGKYEGITGQGTLTGTWNAVTGRLHDEFEGRVDCPKC